ncbi:VanZ family protein [Bradyrhizobium sp. AUGA SZCCT0240]|uniref:VanZ family protein n=1 Tax=unclassified Bradyrhizobium TaxID=2631580 RepID=UPI001BAD2185|nr:MULTISPECIES: VanZ family protein [unclassified Bradyrhizobium]MBR1188436.1 VanZ family protein [Bradyrhizobium sp. AUGA SZCCT0160]MBR1199721.1 VanZ family protein [Bradyrhizobium sp. AUGA SZCCT0158]MBR1243938.1 VanZ family protein [Bradyrhizobium sp. AUGA SZCCT0274]MBR1249072.1 VanZ family protein [Bradyrhizobium sp. AUGA SZCCT0169]MBR1257012.1 VanZ family protein [Bradyrhizobium sp. AUGA SZCCT0240]
MIVGWLALAFIAYATLSPIDARPVLAEGLIEHFVAFALLGLALGFAYPDRVVFVVAIVVGGAVALETMQLLTPDRHGRLLDAAVKAAGGIGGIGAGQWAVMLLKGKIGRGK